jgi:tRNA modification GTPase
MGSQREGPRMLDDTIIAISTPHGYGGLGVVRLSGKEALAAAGRIFRPKERVGRRFPARRAVFGHVCEGPDGPPLDEAFLTYFKAPRSYTGEDVVELSCHGSPAVLSEVVRLGMQAGARPAQPGEFTLRAYVNGRIDILQAEAVNDFIRASSLAQARISFRQLSGSLSKRMSRLRRGLVRLSAQLEAAIEFPEEGLRAAPGERSRSLQALIADVRSLVAGYDVGRALGEGLTVAITGRTNVGKSTLFNALLEEDRAIVTPYPGTTRDYLREKIVVEDFVFNLVDMAGLGKAAHPVERMGIARGERIARGADGLLIVLDASRRGTAEDERLLRRYRSRKKLVVLNKTDLPVRLDKNKVAALAGGAPVVEVSALKGRNIAGLKKGLLQALAPARADADEVILHARQKDTLRDILQCLERTEELLGAGHSEEICAEEVRKALELVGRLTGEVRADEVLEDIFGRFCVGK